MPSAQETAPVIPLAQEAAAIMASSQETATVVLSAQETAACSDTHKLFIAVIELSSDGTEPENFELNICLTTNEKQHQHTQINRSPQWQCMATLTRFVS